MSEPAEPPCPAVIVSVGTDAHRFDRLIDWIDEWQAANRDVAVEVQHGQSRPSADGSSRAWIPHDELGRLFAGASVVVTHGGPSTIMEIRAAGRMPVVVPRDPNLGEHVDDHQIRFAQHLGRNDQAEVVATKAELFERLDRGVADPSAFAVPAERGAAVGLSGFATVVDAILDSSASNRRRR